MQDSLRHLLEHAIDYAGLFPPAGLPMEQAASEYFQVRRDWIVRRFICPINWLPTLAPLIEEEGQPWQISVIGTSLEGFVQDLAAIEKFESIAHAEVTGYEVKASLADLQKFRKFEHEFEDAYVEVAWGKNMLECLGELAEQEQFGAKARTGGLEAAAFPSNEDLGDFLHECCSLNLPFKLTAGLHHAAPFADPGLKATHHGFLNVFGAVIMAVEHDLNRKEIAEILAHAKITFEEKVMKVNHLEADIAAIDRGRELLNSFGSCSVSEPLEELGL